MRTALLLVLPAVAAGCVDSNQASGASEPIFVRGGEFHTGELPYDDGASTPEIFYVAGVGYVVTQGQGDISYSGLASKDAWSVAVAFDGVGTGYWVVPVKGPDVTQDSNLLFGLTCDFTPEVPYGLQALSFVAFDEGGNPGPRYESTVCVLPEYSDGNLAACEDEITPQNAVLSLTWDTDVDLDLVVVTPDGKIVSAKSPTTAIADGTIPSEQVNDPSTGAPSRDSNSNCDIDSIRLESLVFPGEPPPGEYQVYASMYSACGESYTNFQLALYQRVDAEDGTHPVEKTEIASGILLDFQADAGATLGTYVATVTLP